MELVQVQITTTAVTSRYGTLVSGDILRTDAEFARHLVEDCKAGKYVTAPAPAAADKPASKKKGGAA
jgi:hypothetical protein